MRKSDIEDDLLPEEELITHHPEVFNKKWSNQDCTKFYDNLPIETLKNFVKKAGFDTCCDMKLIFPFLKNKKNVLDVGAGYGRTINYLTNSNFSGRITAIENCYKLYCYIKTNYPEVEVIYKDILLFNTREQFDTILCLWAGICDHPKEKQPALLRKLKSLLSPDGIIIIETIPHLTPIKNAYRYDKNYISYSKYGVMYGYTPSKEEVITYANQLNLNIVFDSNYKTDTNCERIMYIMQQLSH